MEEFSYDLNLSRKFLLPDLWLSFGINGKDIKYEQVKPFPSDDYDSFRLKTRICYKDTDFKFYFNEGLQVNIDYILQVNRFDDNSNTKSWKLTVDWQKQFIENNAIQL